MSLSELRSVIDDAELRIRAERNRADLALRLLDEALALLPSTCRYHGENTTYKRYPGIPGPCCDSGANAFHAQRIRELARRSR